VEKRICYIVQIGQCDKNGYIPSVVTEGEPGHSPLTGHSEFSRPWYWGKTYEEAEVTCKKMNTEMGLSERDVTEIVWSSVRLGNPQKVAE
jgi:hypothetical protein